MGSHTKRLGSAALIFLLVMGVNSLWAAAPLPRLVALGTNPAGSAYYGVASGLAKILSEQSGIQVRVQPYSGSSTYIPLLNTGELELGLNNTSDALHAYRGEKPFHPAPNLRMLSVIFPLAVGIVVRNNSDFKRLEDVRGKRVTSRYTAQLAVFYNVGSILASAGLDWKDIVEVPVPGVNEGIQALIEGRADASLHAVGSAKLEEANASIPGGIRFLSIDSSPAGVKRMQSVMAGTFAFPLKAGSVTGAVTDVAVEGYDVYLTAGKSLSDAVAYQITKTLWEQEEATQKANPNLRFFGRDKMVKTIATIPYHSGAIKFFREKGVWSAEMEKVQAEIERAAAK
ncbi:MAG TPA: TAXI family TRAP transporter solute-binding subunit [bacterium]|nr:TAXI family TRAP transporter solute-binding subunit [bacterium]